MEAIATMTIPILLDFFLSCAKYFLRSGAHSGLIGNPVEVGDGPAAVIGDEHRMKATVCY